MSVSEKCESCRAIDNLPRNSATQVTKPCTCDRRIASARESYSRSNNRADRDQHHLLSTRDPYHPALADLAEVVGSTQFYSRVLHEEILVELQLIRRDYMAKLQSGTVSGWEYNRVCADTSRIAQKGEGKLWATRNKLADTRKAGSTPARTDTGTMSNSEILRKLGGFGKPATA